MQRKYKKNLRLLENKEKQKSEGSRCVVAHSRSTVSCIAMATHLHYQLYGSLLGDEDT